MIVIGADTHKRTHALAAVDADTGQLLGEREIAATEQGHLDGLRWAHELGQEIVWAIEDCRHVQRFERSLVSAGERVLRVAPKLMGASRSGEREPGKSDQIDARAIARAVLREGIERFPAAFLDEQAVEIRLLCDHREILVAERTRLINRLRWNLVVLDPELEAKIPSRKLDYPGQLQRITRRLWALPQTARVRVAREQVKRIAALTREAEALKRELRDLVRVHRPELLAETGCGPLCAAILIGQTAGAERFASDAHFARMAGVAPIPASSGRRDRHRLHRGGNRQLNRALHVIAITLGRIDPATRAYLARKEAEGKSRIEAMRCLKRHLARHYHRLLCGPSVDGNTSVGLLSARSPSTRSMMSAQSAGPGPSSPYDG
ncbi:MAG: IS110 family transposase [Solirubrobacteraceae bacterium]